MTLVIYFLDVLFFEFFVESGVRKEMFFHCGLPVCVIYFFVVGKLF